MTDHRQLLELAARAAGLESRGSFEHSDCHGLYIVHPTLGDDAGTYVKWRPLHDDGDALRLAVTLRLDISPQPDGKVEVSNQWDRPEELRWAWEAYGDDAQAATRRAIVSAAAEIGKGMRG